MAAEKHQTWTQGAGLTSQALHASHGVNLVLVRSPWLVDMTPGQPVLMLQTELVLSTSCLNIMFFPSHLSCLQHIFCSSYWWTGTLVLGHVWDQGLEGLCQEYHSNCGSGDKSNSMSHSMTQGQDWDTPGIL